ncbi:hypothetical protein GCU56_18730 [Geodermatophilus sabuli]|uniref:Uncharacterized protein n=1 Tax=Geodermatophilus sabuli TaxID=1564158 RepID=A0A7K3W6S3_9ACTN|nr:hypothetical protein [Geodermatophilus sabuli]NEK59894.1 hypothetical protein [Geodermatophilus sabuli]
MTFHATVAHRSCDREQAVAGLREQLRASAARASAGAPDWSSLVVGDPVPVTGDDDRTWYVWLATVETTLGHPVA